MVTLFIFCSHNSFIIILQLCVYLQLLESLELWFKLQLLFIGDNKKRTKPREFKVSTSNALTARTQSKWAQDKRERLFLQCTSRRLLLFISFTTNQKQQDPHHHHHHGCQSLPSGDRLKWDKRGRREMEKKKRVGVGGWTKNMGMGCWRERSM